ncbi:hypothetical protein JRQ81_008658 [Phrynocephalus forsythii]|uniref:POLO box domain-containing protein n=1 Tax=Phrynocephalus forsythii TaxID=171643 RepID=A0A9Q0XAG7_9SAUR|nr:hypothetical protein JRQ81_008658 [Phrynocephalus forsythii]
MRASLKVSRTEDTGEAEQSPGRVLEMLDHTLQETLQAVPLAKENPQEGHRWPLPVRMVTKWVDYSNKYGFGYQLSDGATGVLLADGTHLSLSPHRQRVGYCAQAGQVASFPQAEVPASLRGKMAVLGFFSRYMQRRLLEGAPRQSSPVSSADEPTLLHVAKSGEALLMVFSDGSLQVTREWRGDGRTSWRPEGGRPALTTPPPLACLPLPPPGQLLPRPHQGCPGPLGRWAGPPDLRGPPAPQRHFPAGDPGAGGVGPPPARAGGLCPAPAPLPVGRLALGLLPASGQRGGWGDKKQRPPDAHTHTPSCPKTLGGPDPAAYLWRQGTVLESGGLGLERAGGGGRYVHVWGEGRRVSLPPLPRCLQDIPSWRGGV